MLSIGKKESLNYDFIEEGKILRKRIHKHILYISENRDFVELQLQEEILKNLREARGMLGYCMKEYRPDADPYNYSRSNRENGGTELGEEADLETSSTYCITGSTVEYIDKARDVLNVIIKDTKHYFNKMVEKNAYNHWMIKYCEQSVINLTMAYYYMGLQINVIRELRNA